MFSDFTLMPDDFPDQGKSPLTNGLLFSLPLHLVESAPRLQLITCGSILVPNIKC